MLKENCIDGTRQRALAVHRWRKDWKSFLSDTPSDAIDDEFEGDEVFQVLNMSETLAKKMEEISRILNKLEVIEEKMRKLDSIEQKMENFSSKLGEIRRTL